jgi:molybdate/tungstate transport system ATP-binding protein
MRHSAACGLDQDMLDVKVSLSRGGFKLDGEIHDSGFICLSGLNGSGKSSLLNVIAGNLHPDEGYVRISSRNVTALPQESRGVVLVTPDSLIPHLDVEKHLRWGAAAKKLKLDEPEVIRTKELLGIAYTGRVDKLSLGMRERVSLATALLSGPQAILVDEAFSNIDNRDSFVDAFRGLCREAGVDVVYSTQQDALPGTADHHYGIVGGKTTRVF